MTWLRGGSSFRTLGCDTTSTDEKILRIFNRAATRGGGTPLNKNSALLNCTACPPKLPLLLRLFQVGGFLLLRLFQVGGFFYWRSIENSENSRLIWRDDLFFSRSTENSKGRLTQKLWPRQKQILLPLEQRSSCGTDFKKQYFIPKVLFKVNKNWSNLGLV